MSKDHVRQFSFPVPKSARDTRGVLGSVQSSHYCALQTQLCLSLKSQEKIMKKDSILLIKISSRKKVKNLGEPVTVCPAGSE